MRASAAVCVHAACIAIAAGWFPSPPAAAAASGAVEFERTGEALNIHVDGRPFARYVFADGEIPRPYFCDVTAPNGFQVTRNHPPVEGVDPTDHADYHPGLWMAFGDINGNDYWRNKAAVAFLGFEGEPSFADGEGRFAARMEYRGEDGETAVCRETARHWIIPMEAGTLLIQDSEFAPSGSGLVFGDQEEMGFGARVATALSVRKGGTIRNRTGAVNEDEVWGRQAGWCAYYGSVDDFTAGVVLMASPQNFRRSWFHARDYGLLLANPFGRKAFTDGQAGRVVVPQGDAFRLTFGAYVFSAAGGEPPPFETVYQVFLNRLAGGL